VQRWRIAFCARLRAEPEQRQITQEKLAQAAGIDR
jgi:hypothetical protein